MPTNQAFQLLVSTISGSSYKPDSVPLHITFMNRGATPIRILNHFEPLPVFLSFDIVKADGTRVFVPSGGKIDFGLDAPGYFDLGPNDSHSINVNLGGLLNRPLEPGAYSISATYHNQYGENCFRGIAKGNSVKVQISTVIEGNS